jgi:hypothetical protein
MTSPLLFEVCVMDKTPFGTPFGFSAMLATNRPAATNGCDAANVFEENVHSPTSASKGLLKLGLHAVDG